MKLRLLFSALFCAMLFSASSQITTVGLIGDGTPGGWDADTNMVQDAADTSLWTMDITLTLGTVKFRANDDWAINWGDLAFPTGVGVNGGDNIPVFAGDYTITFNSLSGEYNFAVSSPIGILGDAVGSWDEDSNMYKDTTDNGYFTVLELVEGPAKFRQDDGWDVNWGDPAFPSGTATQGGENIAVSPAGKYLITFDTGTGEYNFEAIQEFGSIGIIGDATPGGWDAETAMTQDSGNPDLWKSNITLVDGGLKFRANDSWDLAWGGDDFPSGTGATDGGNIPATEGDYQVTFNTSTNEYSFLLIEIYSTVGIIGDATGSWDDDTDMVQDEVDSSLWSVRLVLVDGQAKFRAEDDWPINWGSGDFPMGVGTQDGANIPVTAGEYKITLNTITGDYNFELIVVFDVIGLIGSGSPTGSWDEDTYLVQDAGDEHLWGLPSVLLGDGEVKFRVDSDWAINWGADAWPMGVGTQDGPNIPTVAGAYSVSINTNFGDYVFGDVVATHDLIVSPSAVKVFPNPTSNRLNIDVSDINLKGEVNMKVIDMHGKIVSVFTMDANSIMDIDISNLATGTYLLQINNDKFIIGKKFNVIK